MDVRAKRGRDDVERDQYRDRERESRGYRREDDRSRRREERDDRTRGDRDEHHRTRDSEQGRHHRDGSRTSGSRTSSTGTQSGFPDAARREQDEENGKRRKVVVGSAVAVETERPKLELPATEKTRAARLFGGLMGTLNKFKTETTAKSEAEARRLELEQKITSKLDEEMKQAREVRKKAFMERKQKEREEWMKRVLIEAEAKENEIKTTLENVFNQQKLFLKTNVQTKGIPDIFYIPVKHNEKTTSLLEERSKSELVLPELKIEIPQRAQPAANKDENDQQNTEPGEQQEEGRTTNEHPNSSDETSNKEETKQAEEDQREEEPADEEEEDNSDSENRRK